MINRDDFFIYTNPLYWLDEARLWCTRKCGFLWEVTFGLWITYYFRVPKMSDQEIRKRLRLREQWLQRHGDKPAKYGWYEVYWARKVEAKMRRRLETIDNRNA